MIDKVVIATLLEQSKNQALDPDIFVACSTIDKLNEIIDYLNNLSKGKVEEKHINNQSIPK